MKQLDKKTPDVAVSSVAKRQRIYQRTTRVYVIALAAHAHIVGIAFCGNSTMADGTQANTQQAWHAPAWFAKTTASIPLALAVQRRRHRRPRLTPHCPFEQPCVGESTSCGPFGFFPQSRNVLMPESDRKLNLGNRSLIISLCLACFEPPQPSDQVRPPYTSPSSHTHTHAHSR
jgi:hypothetical protein